MQTKKEEIRTQICDTALKLFAESGFKGSTMAEIAKAAGISVGNIYRYYMNKEDLFYSIITPALVTRLKSFLTKRKEALRGLDVTESRTADSFNSMASEYNQFLVDYRLHFLVIMSKAEGTIYEGVKDEIVSLLENLTYRYIDSLKEKKDIKLTKQKKFLIRVIYDNFINALVSIAKNYRDPEDARLLLEAYMQYHHFGLSEFLE